METKISVFHGRTFAWKLSLKLSYFCSEKIAQSPRWFAHSSDWRNSYIPSKCYCRVFPCNLTDMCVVQGHSSLHCKLLIQVLLAWQVYSDNAFLESWFGMLKKCWRKLMLRCIQRGIAEDCCFFSSWATTNYFTNGGLRCFQTGFPGAISLLHVVPQIALQMEDWGVFRGDELVRFHLLPTFKHWRVFNLTTYKCHLGNI